MLDKSIIAEAFRQLQDRICESLELLDGSGKFIEDNWDRVEGGGGRSCTIQGSLIEKGGVNFSEVHGSLSEGGAKALKTSAGKFFATGVSIVLHPLNPWMPIIHMNVRYFELEGAAWWFGGGIDLTPHYIDPKAAGLFHQSLKHTCDLHHKDFYPIFKKQADDYFYLPHRKETRGVGGIFFDRLGVDHELNKQELFDFTLAVGESFIKCYKQQAALKRDLKFSEKELAWQSMRRGRYVEFNLVWDRGTKFGLETGGRTESILMSMPPIAKWEYGHQVDIDSLEDQTLKGLAKGIDWISHSAA